ncbi:MAG: XdhC family protein [Planctomycetes bacterium]|nr:XdhC family protein [Planctomycetota bacterium]
MRDLLSELTETLEKGKTCVYCAVVETRGSTPQKAGAAMLVHSDGSQTGTLGGGCVEAEVKRRALHALHEPEVKAEILSFSLDDDYGWDDGLICGGRMMMLVSPVRQQTAYYRTYQKLVESGAGCTEIVAITDQPIAGARWLYDAANTLVGSLADNLPPEAALAGLKPLTARPRPFVHKGFSYLPMLPRITLLIVGGGHVGQAVAELASQVEFDVWVLDDREKFASKERFPSAQRLLVGDIGRSLQELAASIDPGFYCLIVTRGHNHDEEALYHLAKTNASYVGMIGSKRKIKLIFEDLLVKGITEEMLDHVHAPLGLPIGSQTVPEIAISIVAELIQARNLGKAQPASA